MAKKKTGKKSDSSDRRREDFSELESDDDETKGAPRLMPPNAKTSETNARKEAAAGFRPSRSAASAAGSSRSKVKYSVF